MKVCQNRAGAGCGQLKPLTAFSAKASNKDGLQKLCKECRAGLEVVRYQNDSETKKQAVQEYRATNHATSRAYRERTKERRREYRRNNRTRETGYVAKRRATLREAAVEHVDYALLLEAIGRWCYLCGQDIQGDVQMDHVHPVARGGHHSYANLRPTHPHCNAVKSDRLIATLRLPFMQPSM